MWRLLFPVVLVGLGASGAAAAQPSPTPATVAALQGAPFAPGAPGADRQYGLGRKLGAGRTHPFYLYAGAGGAAQQLPEDPRWRANHETRSANSLVNTRFGIGWEHDDTRVSLGYLRRQLPDPGAALGDAPHRDSMLGLSVSIHPRF